MGELWLLLLVRRWLLASALTGERIVENPPPGVGWGTTEVGGSLAV